MAHRRTSSNSQMTNETAQLKVVVLSSLIEQMQQQLNDILTDNPMAAETPPRKGSKKAKRKRPKEPSKRENQTGSSSHSRKNNKRKFSHVHHPGNQPTKEVYKGTFPLCDTCDFHHPLHLPCRYCISCNRFGHLSTTCSLPRAQATAAPQVSPTTRPNKKVYNGTHPSCSICSFHHLPTQQCRICAKCNRYGHYTNKCGVPKAQVNQANVPIITTPGTSPVKKTCHFCEDPNHFINKCPLRVNKNEASTSLAIQVHTNPIW